MKYINNSELKGYKFGSIFGHSGYGYFRYILWLQGMPICKFDDYSLFSEHWQLPIVVPTNFLIYPISIENWI